MLVGSLALTVCVVFLQVIMRYVFNSSLSWSEELTRYVFVWQIWLGASLGVREGKHIRVEIIYRYLKGKKKYAVDLAAIIVWFAFCLFLAVNGTYLVLDLMRKNSLSAAMEIPMYAAYASVPVGSGIMGLRLLPQIYDRVVALTRGEGGRA
ncbi:MAG: TRAP transporter small permease [Peptococcaceae bacterium]|nr:TRAP transporter small permease [Peptococcaceae bacterium]